MVPVLESGSSRNILKSVTPLLISSGLVVRNSICDVLDSVAANDSSVLILVMYSFFILHVFPLDEAFNKFETNSKVAIVCPQIL